MEEQLPDSVLIAYSEFLRENSTRVKEDMLSGSFYQSVKEFIADRLKGLNNSDYCYSLYQFGEKFKREQEGASGLINALKAYGQIKEKHHITEVGSGIFGLGSFAIKNQFNCQVTSVDPMLAIENEINGIRFIKKPFVCDVVTKTGKEYSLEKTDMVVSSAACEADFHTVSQCGKNNIPYLILLCNCAKHKGLHGEEINSVSAKDLYLSSLDAQAKLIGVQKYMGFTNLNASDPFTLKEYFKPNSGKKLEEGLRLK